jgi:Na+-translocating ferredoxin:NAD+ oxidoreductase subunit B
MSDSSRDSKKMDRRGFVADGLRIAGGLGLIGLGGLLAVRRGQARPLVWQLDPSKCIACGNCATHCVLDTSAVKCVHSFAMCGYCQLCTGYYQPEPSALSLDHDPAALSTGAEDQLCPAGAIRRAFVEEPYFEYSVDERLCIGCGKCVKGCSTFGNGSLHLQVRHDRCLNCNECSIAVACPSQTFSRVAAAEPYRFKHK